MSLLSPELVAELKAAGLPAKRTGCREPRCRQSHWRRGFCRRHFEARERRLDWGVIEHAIARPVPPYMLSRWEACCAAWILTQRGMSTHNIAARLHVTPRTVTRWRKAWREALQETK